MAKRPGTKAARQKFGPVGVSNLRADAPLDLLQIDHTLVDVIVVDREHRLAIGRPWLTLAIDIATRSVVGFSVSLEAPSALSISLVLTHAVLPKAVWLADRELENLDWPMSGLPHRIHVDNAKEFHSEALVRGCQEYGIMIDHRLRLIGTMMGAVHLLPGTTFSNPIEKKSYESEERAVLTLPELERWLALQIAGVYHLSVHSALGETPLAAWQKGMARGRHPIRHPANVQEFFLSFLPHPYPESRVRSAVAHSWPPSVSGSSSCRAGRPRPAETPAAPSLRSARTACLTALAARCRCAPW
jgi:putative transposase